MKNDAEITGQDELAVERFRDDTRHMIIFDVLSPRSPVGQKGDRLRLFKSFRSVTICSAVLSVLCAFSGIILSILAGTPVGSTIVAVDVAAFAVCYAVRRLTGGAGK